MVSDYRGGTDVIARLWNCDPHTVRRNSLAIAELSRCAVSNVLLEVAADIQTRKPNIIFSCCAEMYDGTTRTLRMRTTYNARSSILQSVKAIKDGGGDTTLSVMNTATLASTLKNPM